VKFLLLPDNNKIKNPWLSADSYFFYAHCSVCTFYGTYLRTPEDEKPSPYFLSRCMHSGFLRGFFWVYQHIIPENPPKWNF